MISATFLADLVRDAGLNAVMIDAALRGSVGSVALLLRILKGRVYVSVLDSLFLTLRPGARMHRIPLQA